MLCDVRKKTHVISRWEPDAETHATPLYTRHGVFAKPNMDTSEAPPSKRAHTGDSAQSRTSADDARKLVRFYRPWWFSQGNLAECNGFTAWVNKRECHLPTIIILHPDASFKETPLSVGIRGTVFEQIIANALERTPNASSLPLLRTDLLKYQKRTATAQEKQAAEEVAQFVTSTASGVGGDDSVFANKLHDMSPDMRRMVYEYGYIAQHIGNCIIKGFGTVVRDTGANTLQRLSDAHKCVDKAGIPELMHKYVRSIESTSGRILWSIVHDIYERANHPITGTRTHVLKMASDIINVSRMYFARYPDMDATTSSFIVALVALINKGIAFPTFQMNEIPTEFAQDLFVAQAEDYNKALVDIIAMVANLFLKK